MTDAIVAAVAGGGVPDLFQDPIWQDEEEAIMDLVTGSQFSQVKYKDYIRSNHATSK